MIDSKNPLFSYMRQPKIYISLPSNGKYWKEGSIEFSDINSYPVYSMTASDEILLKTPDALLSGEGVVKVIQNCIPSIKNAWETPSIDLDLILIALRIATYGDTMSVTQKVPGINEEFDYDIPLNTLIDQLSSPVWEEQLFLDSGLIIFLKPHSYRDISEISQKTFEINKRMQHLDNPDLDEKSKEDIVRASFEQMSDVARTTLLKGVSKIKTAEGIDVVEPAYIKSFFENCDKKIVDTIHNKINEMRDKNALKPIVLHTSEEQQSQGAPESFEIKLNFDNSAFFA